MKGDFSDLIIQSILENQSTPLKFVIIPVYRIIHFHREHVISKIFNNF